MWPWAFNLAGNCGKGSTQPVIEPSLCIMPNKITLRLTLDTGKKVNSDGKNSTDSICYEVRVDVGGSKDGESLSKDISLTQV